MTEDVRRQQKNSRFIEFKKADGGKSLNEIEQQILQGFFSC